MTRRANLSLILCTILAAAAVYLVGNGTVALWDRDEPRYAQTSRQMLQTGDWVVPHYLDMVRTAKPALIYWCQAAAMKLFGDNSFAARFPSAVSIVLLLVGLSMFLWKKVDPTRAAWTVFILATAGLTVASAKMCITDAVLLLFVTAAQLCLYAVYVGRGSWLVVLTWAVATGLAGLTKGPVVLSMQAMTVVVLGLLRLWDWVFAAAPAMTDKEPRTEGTPGASGSDGRTACSGSTLRARLLSIPAHVVAKTIVWLLVVLALTLPWALLAEHRSPGFISKAFSHEVKDRMLGPLEQHSGPPGYYFLSVWVTFFPWSLLLPLAIGLAWRRRSDLRTRFALAAVLGPWLLLEPISTKLPHYLLPAFPPLAFLTADALVRCIGGEIKLGRAFKTVTAGWAVLVAAVASAPWVMYRVYFPVPVLVALSITGLVFAVVVILAVESDRLIPAALSMGFGTLLVVAILFGLYLPAADFLRVSPRVARILIDHGVTQPRQVLMLDYMEPSLAFYQGGTMREAGTVGFTTGFKPRFTPWMTVTKTVWDKATPDVRDGFEVVATVHGLAYADRGKWVDVMVLHRK